jgi:glucose-6-phosphate dehydrogenase assembly protein OpcA
VISLWDTTGTAVVKALGAERRTAGGLTSGLALTLIAVVVDDAAVRAAEAALTIAAAAHPCRLLIVVRRNVTMPQSRLDAEIVVGGRLGPCEAVVMRMHGRLALHAESVVGPLLAPDVPVVTWWYGPPPERIAYDPLGVVADRRITDCVHCEDPIAALRARAEDYAPGDTDLAWTRLTPWRTLLAGAFDASRAAVTGAAITASPDDPSAALLAGWLTVRLGVTTRRLDNGGGMGLRTVRLDLADGTAVEVARNNGGAVLRQTGLPERILPLAARPLGDDLAEELRRLDADQPYAAALSAATGVTDLDHRPPGRVHIWKDPALAERPDHADAVEGHAARDARTAAAAVDATTTEATS